MKRKNYVEVLSLLALPVICAISGAVIDGVYTPASLAINYTLFLALQWLLYAITNRLIISHIAVGLVALLLSFINYAKLNINGTPIRLNDLAMADELGEIAGFAVSQIRLSPSVFVAITLFLVAAVVVAVFEKCIKKTKKIRLTAAAIGAVLAIFLLIPAGSARVSGIMRISRLSSEELTVGYGTSAGLYLAYAKDNEFEKGRNTDSLRKRVSELENREDLAEVTPNVIFVMSESFFDISRLNNVRFSKDPIPNFHELKGKFSSGNFVTSTYCGGTGVVEMEVLTGLCGYYLKNTDDLTTIAEEIYYKMPSISDIFLKNGYELTYLHAYNSSLYNRQKIYTALGFHNILFDNSFPENAERKGGYISDDAFADQIIRLYENKGQKPMMMYAVSMENHQPYPKDKFLDKSKIKIESDRLSREEKDIFSTFIYGLSDADKLLGKLIDYFGKVDEPTVIVFWGDHLPNLNVAGGSVYESLGYSVGGNTALWEAEDLLKMVSTDYVIWDNIGLLKDDKTIGSSMFGLEIIDRLGFGLTDYFAWLKEDIKDDYIICRSRLFAPNENETYSSVPAKYADMMDNYSLAIYDIVYGENKIFESYRK